MKSVGTLVLEVGSVDWRIIQLWEKVLGGYFLSTKQDPFWDILKSYECKAQYFKTFGNNVQTTLNYYSVVCQITIVELLSIKLISPIPLFSQQRASKYRSITLIWPNIIVQAAPYKHVSKCYSLLVELLSIKLKQRQFDTVETVFQPFMICCSSICSVWIALTGSSPACRLILWMESSPPLTTATSSSSMYNTLLVCSMMALWTQKHRKEANECCSKQ